MALVIDDELKAFVESGVSVVIGTRNEALTPEIVRAWGPRVFADRRRISLCLPEATSARTRANLADNGRVSVALSCPSTYKTVQLKGQCGAVIKSSVADLRVVNRHREAFARANEAMGVPRAPIEAFWNQELVGSPNFLTVRFVVEEIFDQTPGPAAGSPR